MKDTNILEALKVQPMSQEEKEKRHILNRLAGPISSSKEETRNGRFYNSELWENALNDPIFQEKIKNKSLFLELGHPADRDETDMSCVCACIPEMPKIIDGTLYAIVDVLDTPNGRLLNTLIDYGFTPGISSRGTGDVDANNEVDPNTFMLETWDIVQVPSLESARLNPITEGLGVDDTQKKLRKALKESLSHENDQDKKIMKDTLKNLGIKLTEPKKKINEDINTQKGDNIDKSSDTLVENKTLAVEDNEANQVVEQLKEALKSKVAMEKQLQRLQEQLAVSDTKVKQLEDENGKLKKSTINLSKQVRDSKGLNEENLKLKEQLETKDKMLKAMTSKVKSLNESIEQNTQSTKSLRENISNNKNDLLKLKESLLLEKKSHKDEVTSLTEKLEKTKKEYDLKLNESNSKLAKSTKLVEKYKNFVNTTVDRYIESKAIMLGVSSNEIKNRLDESYTLDDVDRICEDLQNYNLRMSRLPFNVSKGTKVAIQQTQRPQVQKSSIDDDDVSGLAGIMDRL